MKIWQSIRVAFAASGFALVFTGCATVQSQETISEQVVEVGYVDPTDIGLKAMFGLPKDEPIHMLNMIRLRDKAVYPEGSEFADKGWTGEQAYAEYRRHSGPAAARGGGKAIYVGKPQLTLIEPEAEQWDSIFIIHYSDVGGLIALNQDPEFQKHSVHRKAGVADSRLIRMVPAPKP